MLGAKKAPHTISRISFGTREIEVRVRVERIRRGRRMPEVDYVETRAPRKRPEISRGMESSSVEEPNHFDEIAASNLRLPWRINRSHRGDE